MSSSVENTSYSDGSTALLGRHRRIHDVLGGGLVANILLWRNPKVSALVLLGITSVWLLFEVIEYSLVTLLCHVSITTMVSFFIWRTLAELFKWNLPEIPAIVLQESTFKHVATVLHENLNQFLSKLLDIACRKDLMTFFSAIGALLTLSVVGNYVSSLNLLFISYISAQVLPFIYEKYDDDVDYFASQVYQEMKGWYKKFDETVVRKIPRGPIIDRKMR